ncbi:MAG: glycosyltransferase [Candidatus Didemnitutus sp.]|nr:glycosyltransferase [Candidatus Didemnitutus sp.]
MASSPINVPPGRIDACARLDLEEFLARFRKAPVEEIPHRCPAEPLVSVIMPTYNHARFVAQALDSILAQKVDFPFEICIGEDDSRDGTREICLDYARRFPERIRLFLVPRANNLKIAGIATGRFNLVNLLFHARGRYLAWCEGDDYWTDSTKLARQVEWLERNPGCALTFHDADVYYENGASWDSKHGYAEFPWCRMDVARRDYTARELIESPLCPTASVVLRRPANWRFPLWFFHVPSGDIPIEVMATGAAGVHNFGARWSAYRKHKGGISAQHRGDMIHVGRILTYLGLLSELDGAQLAPLAAAIEKHARELSASFAPYAPEIWDSLLAATRSRLDRAPVDDAAARTLSRVLVELEARRTDRASTAERARVHEVLFLAHGPGQVNGPNIWLTRLLTALKDRGFSPRVLMFMTRPGACPIAERLRATGVPVDEAPFAHTEDMIRTILRYVQAHPCEVFVPNLNVQGYFAAEHLRAAGIATVGVLHSDDDFHRDLVDEFIGAQNGRYLSGAVVVSEFQAAALRAIDCGATQIIQAPYGAPVPTKIAEHATPFRFVYVGRLVEEQKRISETVGAMIEVLRRHPGTEFVICGDGSARPAVEKLIAQAKLGSRIKLLGNLPSEQVQAVLLASQAFVLLSDYEGIPIALMEAMACGLVPLCTRIRSGVGELIRSSENGFFVGDRGADFVAIAERVIADRELWTRCSRAARASIEQRFSVDANADNWAAFLNSLISAAPRERRAIAIPAEFNLPPVRPNPKGIAREDRRLPKPAMNHAAPHPFTNPPLEINNVDLYWTRASILRAVREAAPQFHGVFLDIGCGVMPYREIIRQAAPKLTRYIGLDLEGSAIYRAEVDLRWDGRRIPLEDASVDSAMLTEVLEHCPEPWVVLKEARRVLKPGGVLFFTVPYIWPLHDAPWDFFRYTPFALEKLLAEAGFADVKLQALGGWNASLAQMIGLWLKRSPMTHDARLKMARELWPLYQELVRTDQLPADPKAGNTMATGWTGVAHVPAAQSAAPARHATVGDLPIVLVRSHEFNYSETFVEDHVNQLSSQTTLLYGFPFPRFRRGGQSVLPAATEQKIQATLAAKSPITGELWADYSAGLAAFLAQSGAKAVLVETGLMGAFVHEACEQAKLPFVVHFHGVDAFGQELLGRWLPRYRKFFQSAASVLAVSRAMHAQLLQLGADPVRTLLTPYGVAVDLPALAQPAKAPPHFVAVGRFVEKKAPQLTLQAFAAVHRTLPEARLVMIGDGALLAGCRQWAEQHGLADAVTFAGVCSREEVSRRLAAARVFVQHSVTAANGDSEGLPLAVLEAGAHGLPVVSTRHAGIPDAVREGEDGFLVDEKDVAGMAEAMLRLAQDGELAARLGSSFRARVVAHYSREVSLVRLLDVLRAAAEERPAKELGVPTAESAPPPPSPREAVAEDRNNLAAYVDLGAALIDAGKLPAAYLAIAEAHRLSGGTEQTQDALRQLEEHGALEQPIVQTYRERAGWTPRARHPNPHRILVVTNLLPPQEMGGYGRTVWEFSRELLARGHTVRVLTADMPHLTRKPTAEHAEFERHVSRTLKLVGDWKDGAVTLEPDADRRVAMLRANHQTIMREIDEFGPTAIMAGNLDLAGHFFIQPALDRGIPVLHRLGNAFPGYEPAQSPRGPLFCLAGCSAWVNEGIRAKNYPISRYEVVPPGSPLTEYYRAWTPQRKKLRIAYAGLLMPYKGAHVLVNALAHLARAGIDFECTLAGDTTRPEYLDSMRAVATEHGFLERLSFPGFLGKAELAALYARSNVLVFPSVFEEPFGKTQIEAMAAGLLVVSSGSGGASEIVEHGKTGLLFPASDARALAERLAGAHRNPAVAEKIALAGQARAFAFTTEASVSRIEAIFDEMLAAARSGVPALASTP